ncbi:hypothetical protein [Streptomyces sp. NPDC093707]|uniref:hypothetical protein n=1 Tax=Streptomyces sp. NPDC093707 TaxID=3154984 RepID=UPI00345088B3
MTAASVDHEPDELAYGTYNGFAYMPAMPGIAYRVLFHLIGTQKVGGRCLTTEHKIAKHFGVHRSLVGRGLNALILARMVFKENEAGGVYRLNPMFSGGRSIPEHLEAIGGLDPEDRLDVDDFQDRYDEAVALAELEKEQRKRARSAPGAAAEAKPVEAKPVKEETAGVLSLTDARRRSRRSPRR